MQRVTRRDVNVRIIESLRARRIDNRGKFRTVRASPRISARELPLRGWYWHHTTKTIFPLCRLEHILSLGDNNRDVISGKSEILGERSITVVRRAIYDINILFRFLCTAVYVKARYWYCAFSFRATILKKLLYDSLVLFIRDARGWTLSFIFREGNRLDRCAVCYLIARGMGGIWMPIL